MPNGRFNITIPQFDIQLRLNGRDIKSHLNFPDGQGSSVSWINRANFQEYDTTIGIYPEYTQCLPAGLLYQYIQVENSQNYASAGGAYNLQETYANGQTGDYAGLFALADGGNVLGNTRAELGYTEGRQASPGPTNNPLHVPVNLGTHVGEIAPIMQVLLTSSDGDPIFGASIKIWITKTNGGPDFLLYEGTTLENEVDKAPVVKGRMTIIYPPYDLFNQAVAYFVSETPKRGFYPRNYLGSFGPAKHYDPFWGRGIASPKDVKGMRVEVTGPSGDNFKIETEPDTFNGVQSRYSSYNQIAGDYFGSSAKVHLCGWGQNYYYLPPDFIYTNIKDFSNPDASIDKTYSSYTFDVQGYTYDPILKTYTHDLCTRNSHFQTIDARLDPLWGINIAIVAPAGFDSASGKGVSSSAQFARDGMGRTSLVIDGATMRATEDNNVTYTSFDTIPSFNKNPSLLFDRQTNTPRVIAADENDVIVSEMATNDGENNSFNYIGQSQNGKYVIASVHPDDHAQRVALAFLVDATVRISLSQDGGVTFAPVTNLDGPFDFKRAGRPGLCWLGERLFFVYAPDTAGVKFRLSGADITGFSSAQVVLTGKAQDIVCAASDGALYVACRLIQADGTSRVVFTMSENDGQTWRAPIAIDAPAKAPLALFVSPRTSRILLGTFAVSDDDGKTWNKPT